MFRTLRIANRLVTRPFYRRNLHVFLLIFLLFFGIIRPPQFFISEEFAAMLYGNAYAFGGLVLLGLLYTLWTSRFLFRYAHEPDNSFLKILPAMGKWKCFGLCVYLSLGVQQLILGYFAIMTWHGFALGIPGAFALAFACLLWLILPALSIYRGISRPKDHLSGGLSVLFQRIMPIYKVPFLHLNLLFSRYAFAIFGMKLASVGILAGIINAFPPESPDMKAFALVFVLLACLQSLIPYWLFRGEDNHLGFLRALPISRLKRFGQYCLVYLILLLPELILGMHHWVVGRMEGPVFLSLLIVFFGMLPLWQSLCYTTWMSIGDYMKVVFGLFTLLFFVVMFGFPIWIIMPVFFLGAARMFVVNYYGRDQEMEAE